MLMDRFGGLAGIKVRSGPDRVISIRNSIGLREIRSRALVRRASRDAYLEYRVAFKLSRLVGTQSTFLLRWPRYVRGRHGNADKECIK